jgi:hypothetical protein
MRKNRFSKTGHFTAWAAVAAILSACGGGGSDTTAGATTDTTTGTTTGTTTSASSDPIDKYIGTYVGSCSIQPYVYSAATGAPLYGRQTITMGAKLTASKASVTTKSAFYSAADCSGTPQGTLSLADSNTYVQVDATVTMAGQQLDKVSAAYGVYFPGISASSITINGIKYTGAPYTSQAARTYKDLFLLQANSIYSGDPTKPLDAQGYPTVLLTAVTFTKQ